MSKSYFKQLDSMLQGRNEQSKKEAHNTYWQRRGDNIVLLYHKTDVFSITPNGDMTLNSGGWLTSTTKERINMALPVGYYVHQKKSVWYLNRRDDGEYVFQNGMEISAEGKVNAPKRNDKKEKATAKWVKKVNDFAKEMVERAFDGRMKAPSAGDCWYCLMKTEDGKTLGDSFDDNNHIVNHIKEKYYVPSMFWNAMGENRGCLSIIAESNLAILQEKQRNGKSNHEYVMLDVVKYQCYKAMRKYLRKRLNLPS
jgi:hypothetical protein